MVFSLLYVSFNAIPPERHADEVKRIVEWSLTRNAELAVTGALVGTPLHFAQVIEGEREAVETLMRSIEADARHTRVSVIDTQELPERGFARWSLAHIGPSEELEQMMARAAERYAEDRLTGAEAWRLRSLIDELAYKQLRDERYRGLT